MTQPPNDPWGTPPQPGQPQQPGQPPQPPQPGVPPVPPAPPTQTGGGYYGNPPGYAAPGYGAPGGPPPPNNLVWAILATILCCLPLGIVSIVYAAQVNSKWATGDVAGAYESSKKSKTWAIWSAAAGLVAAVLYAIFVVVLILAGDTTTTYTT